MSLNINTMTKLNNFQEFLRTFSEKTFLPIEICERIWKFRMQPFNQTVKLLEGLVKIEYGYKTRLCPYSCCFVFKAGLGLYRFTDGVEHFPIFKKRTHKKARYYTWCNKDGSYNKFCYD